MYKNIVIPIDINSKNSWELAITAGFTFAKQFGSELNFITVVPDYGLGMVQQYFPKGWVNEIIQKSKLELVKIIEASLKGGDGNSLEGDLSYNIIVERGAVYQVIIDQAMKVKADLIIMPAHHPNRSDYLLGPNTAKVVRHSSISVLVVRE
ncbi:MAG: universal stress protein [Alphaproteobacteria bacterium]